MLWEMFYNCFKPLGRECFAAVPHLEYSCALGTPVGIELKLVATDVKETDACEVFTEGNPVTYCRKTFKKHFNFLWGAEIITACC